MNEYFAKGFYDELEKQAGFISTMLRAKMMKKKTKDNHFTAMDKRWENKSVNRTRQFFERIPK